MKNFFEGLKSGEGFNRRVWEEKWVMSTGVSKIKPYKNPVAMAEKLVKKAYSEKLPALPVLAEGDTIADWNPNNVSTTWAEVEWNISEEQLKTLKGIRFIFQKGNHRLDIASVELIADGQVIAKEEHHGNAGKPSKANSYLLEIPKKVNANNGCSIRAKIRTAGGSNSYGKVILIQK